MPEKVRITSEDELFTGADKTLQFTVLDANDVPVDITGWSVLWGLYPNPFEKGSTPLVTKTVGSGITLTTPLSGVLRVALLDTDTDNLPGAESYAYYHELRRTDGGLEDVLAYGDVMLRQSPFA